MLAPTPVTENALADVMIMAASAAIVVVQLRSWKSITDITGELANLKATIAGIPASVAAQVAHAMEAVHGRITNNTERLARLEATCSLRHSERNAEMRELLDRMPGD